MSKKIDIEQIFLSALHSDTKLRWFLQYQINLINYLDAKWPKYMALTDLTIALIPKNKVKEVIGDIDAGRILKVLEKERPDLYQTIKKDPNGINWLVKQIENFRTRFL